MKVDAIKSFCINPIFTSKKPVESKYNKQAEIDIFQRNEYDIKIDKFCKNLQDNLHLLSVKDVKKMANIVSVKTGYNLDEVYYTMGALSQYSSYKSLSHIKRYMLDKNTKSVSNIMPFYEKEEFSPCLANVMHYIGLKSFSSSIDDCSPNDKINKALFLDSKLINIYKNLSDRKKESFKKEYLNNDKILPIYIKNFENGYNFLNQSIDFSDYTINILNKVKTVQNNSGKSFDEALDFVLNGKLLKNFSVIGIDPYIINKDIQISPEDIAKNLNPITPSKEEILKTIDYIIPKYKSYDTEQSKLEIIDFLNKMTVAISPKEYCKLLKNMNKQINKFAQEKGKSQGDIVYLIPSKTKSYIIANYQYFKLNKIQNPKIMYHGSSPYEYMKLAEDIPDGAILVILDDCVMSGSSYLNEMFSYNNVIDALKENKKDINIIFAPLLGTRFGINRINKYISKNHRQNEDKIIYEKILPEWKCDINKNSIIYPYEKPKDNPYITSMILPYMGPDSNCETLIPLYEKFFVDPYAQKMAVNCINYTVMY